MRVGFYEVSCPNGTPEPNNGERRLPVGCRGLVTATPKYADGSDVPPEVHGPNIIWDLPQGAGVVRVEPPTFPDAFNKDLVGVSPGHFRLCATVQGVTGCLAGEVT